MFSEDDEKEFNPKSEKKEIQEDIKIGKMDGEKVPDFDPLFLSYSTDYSEDPDYDSDERRKRKKHKSKDKKDKSKDKKNRSKSRYDRKK